MDPWSRVPGHEFGDGSTSRYHLGIWQNCELPFFWSDGSAVMLNFLKPHLLGDRAVYLS
jgi:hypothetical protein